MTVLLTNARLIDPEARTEDFGTVVVENGVISQILSDGDALPRGEVVDCHGKCLAPGIIDIGVKVCEPGERHKESFRTAGEAAAAGGVTTMVVRPDTEPSVDSPETLQFARRESADGAGVMV